MEHTMFRLKSTATLGFLVGIGAAALLFVIVYVAVLSYQTSQILQSAVVITRTAASAPVAPVAAKTPAQPPSSAGREPASSEPKQPEVITTRYLPRSGGAVLANSRSAIRSSKQ